MQDEITLGKLYSPDFVIKHKSFLQSDQPTVPYLIFCIQSADDSHMWLTSQERLFHLSYWPFEV